MLKSRNIDHNKRCQIVCCDRNPSPPVTGCIKRQITFRERRINSNSVIVVSSVAIEIRAKITYKIAQLVESCVTHYFHGKTISEEKVHGFQGRLSWVVGYTEARYLGFYCNQGCHQKVYLKGIAILNVKTFSFNQLYIWL